MSSRSVHLYGAALACVVAQALACAAPTVPYRSQAVISAHYALGDRSAEASRQCLRNQLLARPVLSRGESVLDRSKGLGAGPETAMRPDSRATEPLPSLLHFRMLFDGEEPALPGDSAVSQSPNAVVLVSFDHASPRVAANVTNAVARAWLSLSKWEGLLGRQSCMSAVRIDRAAVSLGLRGL